MRIILNSGRYELRIVTSEPNWTANDGEMVLYHDTENDRKYLYIYISDDWYAVTFLSAAGSGMGGVRMHNIGEMFIWCGSDVEVNELPANTIVCNGADVSRTTYSQLFEVISTRFGAGDGYTTFNVPDMRGRFPLGLDNMGGTSANRVSSAEADTIGGADGAEDSVAAHTHKIEEQSTSGQAGNNVKIPGDFGGACSSTGTSDGNMPPYLSITYLIQA